MGTAVTMVTQMGSRERPARIEAVSNWHINTCSNTDKLTHCIYGRISEKRPSYVYSLHFICYFWLQVNVHNKLSHHIFTSQRVCLLSGLSHCAPLSCLSLYLAEPLGHYTIWPVTVMADKTSFFLWTIKFHCPLSRQGIEVEMALKWTISLVCAPYPLGQRERSTLRGEKDVGNRVWFRMLPSLLAYHFTLWG